jgi:N-acetylglutamate synthase-like GNAT family acetyltransferase
MTTPEHQVRRATVEDLPQLRELWRQANLPWQDLEKQFKDFQIVQAASGPLLAAIGLRLASNQGWLFSEAFAQPDQAETLRPLLWERVRIVAQNHGLVRLWTQGTTPFWQVNGFLAAGPEQLAKRPESFATDDRPWLVIQLRDEGAASLNLDKEFAVFQEAQKEERERLMRQARVAKLIALVVGLAVFAAVIVLLFRFQSAASRRPPTVQQP